jgi:hypothetical protein
VPGGDADVNDFCPGRNIGEPQENNGVPFKTSQVFERE